MPPPLAGQKTGRRSKRGGRDEGGSRTLRGDQCRRMYEEIRRRLRCASTGGRGFSCGVVRARGSSLRILPTYISYPFYQRIGAAGTRGTMWKTARAVVLVPREDDPG